MRTVPPHHNSGRKHIFQLVATTQSVSFWKWWEAYVFQELFDFTKPGFVSLLFRLQDGTQFERISWLLFVRKNGPNMFLLPGELWPKKMNSAALTRPFPSPKTWGSVPWSWGWFLGVNLRCLQWNGSCPWSWVCPPCQRRHSTLGY